MCKKEILPITIIVLLLVIGIVLYPSMPDRVPTHWNTRGDIDDYSHKFVGVLLIPLIIVVVYLLFIFIPKIMVYKENFRKFERYYHGFKLMMIAFLGSLYIITLLPNFGITVDMNRFMIIVLAVLFYYIGHIMQFFKRNYFIGIRTPWTLSNEKVWDRTHNLSSRLFRLSAVIMLFALLTPDLFIWFLSIPLALTIIITLIYSYKQFKKIGGKIDKKTKK